MNNHTDTKAFPNGEDRYQIQVKICGLTTVSDAIGCATLGADAIGCVFFPKSPRHVTMETARDISRAVAPDVKPVGVFVNATFTAIMKVVDTCHLSAVQLHGQESPHLINRLRAEGVNVIKALFVDGRPSPERAADYRASAFLVECAQGPLPGGNAVIWNYASVKKYNSIRPLILAGGLSLQTVSQAIETTGPDAVDVSSGVESRPGIKAMDKVSAFIRLVRQSDPMATTDLNPSIF